MAKYKMTNINDARTTHELIVRRKKVDTIAAIGMVMIALGLLVPLFNMLNLKLVSDFKWIFAVGALMFLGARCVKVSSPAESLRLTRLRRLEFWAGACFAIATFFWFYNENRVGPELGVMGALAIIRDTILFSMAGALIQVIASWLIYFREKKEKKQQLTDNK